MDFLCLDFINSRWQLLHKPFQERLADQAWLAGFCDRWELPLPRAEEIGALAEFREFLFEAARELAEQQALSPARLERLNACLQAVPLENRLEFSNGAFRLASRASGPDCPDGLSWTTWRMAMSLAELAAGQPLAKLKICGNPDCGWIFLDLSKNQTRKWCDNTCASLVKVRRFRAGRSSPLKQHPVLGDIAPD